MTASPAIPDPEHDARALMFWLPPHGFGNGVPARAWAILADLTEKQVYPVLFALAGAHIAGYVATEHATTLQPGDPGFTWRLWVDSLKYSHAETLLMEQLRQRNTRA